MCELIFWSILGSSENHFWIWNQPSYFEIKVSSGLYWYLIWHIYLRTLCRLHSDVSWNQRLIPQMWKQIWSSWQFYMLNQTQIMQLHVWVCLYQKLKTGNESLKQQKFVGGSSQKIFVESKFLIRFPLNQSPVHICTTMFQTRQSLIVELYTFFNFVFVWRPIKFHAFYFWC